MRRAIPHIVECKSTTRPWYIDMREAGRRRRKFFRTITEARQELDRIKIKLRREGAGALELSDELRVTALRISRDLEPFGKTLRDAGEFYLKHLRESQKSIAVGDLAEEFREIQRKLKRSQSHQDDLKNAPEPLLRGVRRVARPDHRGEGNRGMAAPAPPFAAKREQLPRTYFDAV